MGQYWRIVNLSKREYLDPHALGSGEKAWEQLANQMPSKALYILTLAQPEMRGGGDLDLDLDSNWQGLGDYPDLAHAVIGRWAGDRIAVVGDYAESDDLIKCGTINSRQVDVKKIYSSCMDEKDFDSEGAWEKEQGITKSMLFTNVTAYVQRVLEHELNGKFVNTGHCSSYWMEGKDLEAFEKSGKDYWTFITETRLKETTLKEKIEELQDYVATLLELVSESA